MSTSDVRSVDGFTRFYEMHLDLVYGYLFRLCAGDQQLAEDLTQDTWVALAKRLKAGHIECADIRWLLTVARRRFLDQVRQDQRRTRRLTLVRDDPEHHDPPTRHEVLDGMSTLDPMHRLVLMLRYVDDLPVPSVADVIGRNLVATNSLLARARADLRRQTMDAT